MPTTIARPARPLADARLAWVRASLALVSLAAGCDRVGTSPGLTVFNAAALGPPLKSALAAFAASHPTLTYAQENAPSLEVVRKMTELGHTPDVLAVADEILMSQFVVPAHASWYVRFGTNAMVLAFSDRAAFAAEISTENWWRILLRPGVQVGRSDLRVDPSGYRADMVMQLAETFYGEPGLTDRLRASIPERNVRRAEADLGALLLTGELDYGWTYENLAVAHGLRYIRLPREIDLSAPEFADRYAAARIELPNPDGSRLLLRGAPIIFALTVPARAGRSETALRFVEFLLSVEGRDELRRSGFTPLPEPEFLGTPPEGLALSVRRASLVR